MFTLEEKTPEIRLWEVEVAEHRKNIRVGDKLVPIRGAYEGIPVKVVKMCWRDTYLTSGKREQRFYLYCNRVKT